MTGQEARDDEREALAWIERTLALPIYQNPVKDSYGEGVVEALRTVQKIIQHSARKHPEPEITEMVERAVRATWRPSEWLNADQNDASRTAYADAVRDILEAALRVPVGEGEQ